MSDEFFAKLLTRYESCNITEHQLATLKVCIEGRMGSREATEELSKHPDASPTPLELQQRLAGLWDILNTTAVELPIAQPTIISILQNIRKLPPVKVPTGEGEDYFDFDDGYFWRELTGWANDWADSYNYYGAQYLIEKYEGSERVARKQAWISANEYTARLAATGDQALASYDAALDRARFVIVDALEIEHGSEDQETDQIEAAVQLFVHAPNEWWRRSKRKSGAEEPPDPMAKTETETDRQGRRLLWRGQDGYSRERWEFWKRRWEFLASEHGYPEKIRQAALEALQAMSKVEAVEYASDNDENDRLPK